MPLGLNFYYILASRVEAFVSGLRFVFMEVAIQFSRHFFLSASAGRHLGRKDSKVNETWSLAELVQRTLCNAGR